MAIKPIILFFLLIIIPSISWTEEKLPTPPELIKCPSPETCDRNPKHLEAYVADFYIWYLKTDSYSHNSYDKKLTTNDTRTIKNKISQYKTDVLNRQLTPKYLEWFSYLDTFEGHDAPCNPNYCYNLMCGSDWDDDLYKNISASLEKTATVETSHPIAKINLYFDGKDALQNIREHNKIFVSLKVDKDVWKIDSVTSPKDVCK